MSDSAFSADLDALVHGEHIAPNDELARFVSDLYKEEQNVTMPNTLRLRIANDLGLAQADDPSPNPAPVSRRTRRAGEQHQRSSRPWAIGLAIAAALLIALTGVLRWGMPTGTDDANNQFMFSSPAVPTVAATPDASPEGENDWLSPFTADECLEDELIERAEWINVQNERAASYAEVEHRRDQPYSAADIDDAKSVVIRHRQAMACLNRGDGPEDRVDALPIESPRKAWENSVEGSVNRDEIGADRVERGKALSSYIENDLDLTADDLVHATDGEPGLIWEPANAVQMDDGRIALIPGWATNSEDLLPGFQGFAPVWQNIDGEWLLDEELFFCIGECDDYWEQRESVFPDATPIASPEADITTCEANGFEVDFTIDTTAPVNMWPEPEVAETDAVAALQPGTRLMWLCETELTSDPDGDQLEKEQWWMLFRTEAGTEGWIREIDVREYQSEETEQNPEIEPVDATSATEMPRPTEEPESQLPQIEPLVPTETPAGSRPRDGLVRIGL